LRAIAFTSGCRFESSVGSIRARSAIAVRPFTARCVIKISRGTLVSAGFTHHRFASPTQDGMPPLPPVKKARLCFSLPSTFATSNN
jgi:hypothetical protein